MPRGQIENWGAPRVPSCTASAAPPPHLPAAASWKPPDTKSPQDSPGRGAGGPAGREGCRPLPAPGSDPLLATPWAVATAVSHAAGAGVTQRSGQPAGRLPAAAARFLSSGVRASAHVGAGSGPPSRHRLALSGHRAGAVRAAAPQCLR